MSKTNQFTLIATFLLGILLYTILQFAADLPESPMAESARIIAEESAPADLPSATVLPVPGDPGPPRISSHDELVAFLDEQGMNGRLVVDEAARWYAGQGFPGAIELFGVTLDNAPSAYYDTLDEPTLQAMSETGDAGATQELARIEMFIDPFAALALYEKAATQGSVYAIIKVADTLSLFADSQLSDYLSDAEHFQKLLKLQRNVPSRNLHTEAYAKILSALSAGGPPIINEKLLAMTARFEGKAPQRTLVNACWRSTGILVETSAARRNYGVEPLPTRPPPVFLSPPDVTERMPCTATQFPISSAMDVKQCRVERVIVASGDEADLYICQR